MDKNNTGKYLKYAIGEIVLVVIGILIALGINNWNEKPVSYNYVGSNGQKLNSGNLTIEANSFLLGENYLSTGEYIQVIKNEDCHAIYGRSREDYIVIH